MGLAYHRAVLKVIPFSFAQKAGVFTVSVLVHDFGILAFLSVSDLP